MNRKMLSVALRTMVRDLPDTPHRDDVLELLSVLARVVEGKDLARAFGAPGDFGYGTPIGDALAAPTAPDEARATVGAAEDEPTLKTLRCAAYIVWVIDYAFSDGAGRHPDRPDWHAGYRACLEELRDLDDLKSLRDLLRSAFPSPAGRLSTSCSVA